jgi:hypothetical protein
MREGKQIITSGGIGLTNRWTRVAIHRDVSQLT